MNKKILISSSLIFAVAAVVVGMTAAYFSDTETSTGNTFTAGSIDLMIDNHCYYNDYECVSDGNDGYVWAGTDESCSCTWELTDLTDELFFDFADLKPGDWGEDTVSLHVYDNDAWGCVAFENMVDYDNGCTEPEAEDGDTSCGNPGPGKGELSENLFFGFWADMCDNPGYAVPGDNIFQEGCEGDVPLMWGLADEILPGATYVLAAPGYDNVFTGEWEEPLIGSVDYYIGKVWCFGMPGWDGQFTCDGQPVDNITQTDSLTGDIVFYAEQSRNNDDFVCPPPREPITTVCGDGWVTGNEQCESDADCEAVCANLGLTVGFCRPPGPLGCGCVCQGQI